MLNDTNNPFRNCYSIFQSDDPVAQLRNAIESEGLTAPERIWIDGKIHRFKSSAKDRQKSGWYVAFNDSAVPAGKFGCWKTGIEKKWRAQLNRPLTEEETQKINDKQKRAAELLTAEGIIEHSKKAVNQIWESSGLASDDHPYLLRKKINANGARITGDGRLVVPLLDTDGSICSLQYIDHNGEKRYHPSAETKGKFWSVGDILSSETVYIAEGFATAASISRSTSSGCIIAYSASNLIPVSEKISKIFVDKKIIIVADNDASGVGERYAEQAAAKFGIEYIVMPEAGDANDYEQAGGDLNSLLSRKQKHDDWLVRADDFCSQPAPIKWLIKGWLQENAMMMIHGPSGGGKTFCVLDMCCHIASGNPMWSGHKVKNGEVVYLAGEGHFGLRGRLAAWKQSHGIDKLNLWLSRYGCDLNKTEGYIKVVSSLKQNQIKPKLIVVDTLHRFLEGDENSAQDAKKMLDACSKLMHEFSCSVILVHHTGVSEESQSRGRGSSAWRGALDIEINISAVKNSKQIKISQKKSKDAEISDDKIVSLKSVKIEGWLDEDNEPVFSAIINHDDAPTIPTKQTNEKKILESLAKKYPKKIDSFHAVLKSKFFGEFENKTDAQEAEQNLINDGVIELKPMGKFYGNDVVYYLIIDKSLSVYLDLVNSDLDSDDFERII